MNVVWWLITGLIAGAIARLVVPGHFRLGLIGTLLLGLAGSLIGGFLGYLLENSHHKAFSPAGLLGSILGAIVALLVYRWATRRRRGWRRLVRRW